MMVEFGSDIWIILYGIPRRAWYLVIVCNGNGNFGAGSVPLPEQLPSSTPFMHPVESEAPVQLDNASDYQSTTEKSTSLEMTLPEWTRPQCAGPVEWARRRTD